MPFGLVEFYQPFRGFCSLHHQRLLPLYELKTETAGSSDTSVHFQDYTRHTSENRSPPNLTFLNIYSSNTRDQISCLRKAMCKFRGVYVLILKFLGPFYIIQTASQGSLFCHKYPVRSFTSYSTNPI
jgi:hypothetical protein